jgi:hypothetical protein
MDNDKTIKRHEAQNGAYSSILLSKRIKQEMITKYSFTLDYIPLSN